MVDLSRTIPTGEPERFRVCTRRTSLLRFALLVVLASSLVLAVLVASRESANRSPLVAKGTTGMLVLDLSASVYEGAFGETIRKLAAGDERVGVVVFSDAAYELVPPGTPGRELLPLLRFFAPRASGQLPLNPWEQFSAGTQVSKGLELAGEVLRAHHVRRGSIVLVSDLEILPDEIARVGVVAAKLANEGVELRIVPLFPTPEKLARARAILGSAKILRGPSEKAPVRAPGARSVAAAAPWAFLGACSLLVVLLAVNEGILARLEVRHR